MQDGAAEQSKPNDGLLPPGTLFGKYRIVRSIGVGGMGGVYEATHTLLKKAVALKTLHALLATHDDHRARFLREGEAVARIRHPNVVDVSDVGIHEGIPFLVMELLHGENLHELLRREGTLDEKRMATLMVPIADGLSAAHAAGVIHRDLKPENIFLARDGKGELRPKLVDFGISKLSDTMEGGLGVTGTGALLGTPYYMSPEQAQGGAPVDARCDQYALGVMLYECATGRLPFFQERLLDLLNAISQGVFLEPRVVHPELSSDFENIILRAMATSPDARFPSVEDFGRALLPFASSRVRAEYGPSLGVPAENQSSFPPPMRASAPGDVVDERRSGSGLGGSGRRAPRDSSQPTSTGRGPTPVTIDPPAMVERTTSPERHKSQAPPSRRGVAIGTALLLVLLASGGAFAVWGNHGPTTTGAPPPVAPAAPTTFPISVDTVPATAAIDLDGVAMGTAELATTLPRDGRYHTLRVTAVGFEPRVIHFHDALPDGHVVLDASPVVVEPVLPPPVLPPPADGREPHHPRPPHGGETSGTPPNRPPPDDIRLNR